MPTMAVEERVRLDALYASTFEPFKEGSMLEGSVLTVQPDGVIVDIGYKSAGLIPKTEFAPKVFAAIHVGDRIWVYLENQEDANGHMVLSKERADRMQVWGDIEILQKNETPVESRVLAKTKGGVIVELLGVKAFLPASQIDMRAVRDLDALSGKTMTVRVIKMDSQRGNIVVSRRAILEESRDSKRKKALSVLQEGQIIEGTIKNITEYGAFVDLGGIDGLLHITDMSWSRMGHPSEQFTVGMKLSVILLKCDKDTGRISLGYKQHTPDPWSQIDAHYTVGSVVTGKAMTLTDYGAFVELEHGIEGLVHVSDMSWSHEMRPPSKVLSIGEPISVMILSIDRKNRKLSLGIKQVSGNPWETLESRYPVGTKISGPIRSLTDFGVFIGIEEGVDGLLHVSDMALARHIKHPAEMFKKGQHVEAVILKVDRERERISLGCKPLSTARWEEVCQKYIVGSEIKGRISKITHFGLFVEIMDNVEGLVHISESGLSAGDRLDHGFHIGDEVTAIVMRTDVAEHKISLSIAELARKQEAGEVAAYQTMQKDVPPTSPLPHSEPQE